MTGARTTLSVDFLFSGRNPGFGDLFRICGYDHPNFPAEGAVDFRPFQDLAVSQVDDYFGVRTTSGEGADVAVWIYPLVGEHIVDHHPGPFDGLRLDYDILRNPTDRFDHYLKMLRAFERQLTGQLYARGQKTDPDLIEKEAKIAIDAWRAQGIEPGSPNAMLLHQ